jgi:hypothetical protein
MVMLACRFDNRHWQAIARGTRIIGLGTDPSFGQGQGRDWNHSQNGRV